LRLHLSLFALVAGNLTVGLSVALSPGVSISTLSTILGLKAANEKLGSVIWVLLFTSMLVAPMRTLI